jgi:alpha-mannosidase
MAQKLTLHIVPHTHWDREWYFTLEEFRYRLVKLIDTLLRCMEGGAIEYFVLDGQTIALEDYLEVRPENRDRLLALIQSGRLLVGPWYTQPNTFMSGAEAQVRNLLRGRQEMAAYGGGMADINYLPDQFGFNSQMPQVMAGFGMTHLVGARGLPKGCDTYFIWVGSDQTAVKVCALPNSYNNANGFCDRSERKTFRVFGEPIVMPSLPDRLDLVLREQARAVSPQLLALNGVDHMFPNTSMLETIAKIRELHPEVEVEQSTFRRYIDAVEATLQKALVTCTGEQRDPRENLILPASQSMRMDIKKFNRRLEDLLERRVEPLVCRMASLGEADLPLAELRRAWEYMLQNQAHDSLCCANSDPSYREIFVRFEKVDDIAREICNELDQRFIRRLCGLPEEALLLLNPTPQPRDEPVAVDVIVSNHRAFWQPHLFCDGVEIPAYVQGVKADGLLRFVPFSGWVGQLSVAVFRMTIQPGAVPALGYKLLEIRGGGQHDAPVDGIVSGFGVLENEYLRVSVNPNASIDVTDKRTGRTFREVHSFIDNGETGGGFQHIPPLRDETAVSAGRGLAVSIIENNPLQGVLSVRQTLCVPAGLAADTLARSRETAEIGISSRLILRRGCPYLEFETQIENTAKDHRLRVAFPTDIESETGYAGQPFDVVERPVQPARVNHLDQGDYEPFLGYHPMHDFCGISDGVTGVTVAGDGIMEYEILPMRKTLCLTLLRTTDRLHVGVMATGSKFKVPLAQLLGPQEFRYAFIPYRGGFANSLPAVERFRHPIRFVQKDFLEAESMPDYRAPSPVLPACGGLIAVDSVCVTTALKPAESGQGMVLRLYNPTDRDEPVRITVASTHEVLSAERVRLDETPVESLAPANTFALSAGPRKIVSLRIEARVMATLPGGQAPDGGI